ncbi:MAG: sensor histidine kinase, partial [bacterium]
SIKQRIKTHQNNGVLITANLTAILPPIHFSAGEIQTVLDELISNAQHAMQHCTTKEITFETSVTSNAVLLEVRDTGTGIASEQWQEIFKRKYTTKEQGGLGLYMLKQIMERYGGDIRVKESSPTGTTFILHFRRAE